MIVCFEEMVGLTVAVAVAEGEITEDKLPLQDLELLTVIVDEREALTECDRLPVIVKLLEPERDKVTVPVPVSSLL